MIFGEAPRQMFFCNQKNQKFRGSEFPGPQTASQGRGCFGVNLNLLIILDNSVSESLSAFASPKCIPYLMSGISKFARQQRKLIRANFAGQPPIFENCFCAKRQKELTSETFNRFIKFSFDLGENCPHQFPLRADNFQATRKIGFSLKPAQPKRRIL